MDPLVDATYTTYGYVPTRYVTVIFVVLFSVSTLVHVGQSIQSRMWWLLPTAGLCGALEVLGWSARLWSSVSPELFVPYQIQIIGTILAPTPLLAANFIILGRLINYLGPVYSRLSARSYILAFCTCDVISLVVQAVGGGMASLAASSGSNPNPGGNVMLVGIIFQTATITIYASCAIEFFVRYSKEHPLKSAPLRSDFSVGQIRRPMDLRIRAMSSGLIVTTAFLFIRSGYRTIELSDGWDGRIITTETYFNVFDGAMVVLAMYTLNISHPGVLLKHLNEQATNSAKKPSDSDSSIGMAV